MVYWEGYLYLVVYALNRLQAGLDCLLDLVLGYRTKTGWKRDRNRATQEYEKSAQMVRIRFRGAFNLIWCHSLSNFFYTHEDYVSPTWVLDRDHVTVQLVTPTHVVFSVADQGEDIYDMKKHPFVMLAQFTQSRRLLIIPLWSFSRLSEEAGDPPADVEYVGICNSARSGSTLLTQMFDKLPDTVAMSEAWALYYAHLQYVRGHIAEKEFPRLVRGLLRMQFKPMKSRPCKRMAIKLTVYMAPMFEIIREQMPSLKMFFNTRHPKKSMVSYFRTFQAPMFSLFLKYEVKDIWYDILPFDYHSEHLQQYRRELKSGGEGRRLTLPQDCALEYAGAIDYYLRHKHLYLYCVHYEDLLADPEGETGSMFDAIGVPRDLVATALTAMKVHSQGGMFEIDRHRSMTDKDLADIEAVFRRVRVPINLDMTLEEYKALF